MPSLDISRESFQREKNYSGLRQQQGRVPLDSEVNESYSIIAEELRRTVQDVICSSGTPDDGFKIDFDGVSHEDRLRYDFNIGEGSYFIGGTRYDNLGDTTYLTQADWLQIELDNVPPLTPSDPGTLRRDFVWLEGWEQPVSATEDSECFERALGGPDTAGRLRRFARVHVMQDSPEECPDAMAALLAGLDGGIRNPKTHEIKSGITLSVGFNENGPNENLCSPQTQDGFLGANNETYRVQMTAADRFIFGRDNASPLYRVQVGIIDDDGDGAGERRVITFLTQPKDSHSQPLAGHAVEIFRWNTLLPNGEKIAEPIGLLTTVESDYDPETDTITIAEAVPQEWDDWFSSARGQDAINSRDESGFETYFYLRLWTGGSGDSTQPDHAVTAGTAQPLGDTGLTVTFNGLGRAGEYWIAAARPNAPDIVTPWTLSRDEPLLLNEAPPMGPSRRIAPLAIITWESGGDVAFPPVVKECREVFRKLCSIDSCCKVTVGDGEHSFGDTNSIQDAISLLPEEGGEICLLAGHFVENVNLRDRNNITFKGCGDKTIWEADEEDESVPVALHITHCTDIHLQHFTMRARHVECVLLGEKEGAVEDALWSREIVLSDVKFFPHDHSAVWANGVTDFRMLGCRVFGQELTESRAENVNIGMEPAVFALGDGMHFETNGIHVSDDIDAASRPLGGIQIGGNSRHVRIRDNWIIGGAGNGITLGHIEWVERDVPQVLRQRGRWTFGQRYRIKPNGCLEPDPLIPPRFENPNETEREPRSAGEVENLVIDGNQIHKMGAMGITVAHFFDLGESQDYIAISQVRINSNIISKCLQNEFPDIPLEEMIYRAYGAITLSACDDLWADGNEIFENGAEVTAANCGIFILFGTALRFTSNRIYKNGAAAFRLELNFGRRGGLVIGFCTTSALKDVAFSETLEQGLTQCLVCHENYIDSAHGQALKVLALGPVSVTDNKLNGSGQSYEQLALFSLAGIANPPVTGLLFFLAGALAATLQDREAALSVGVFVGELLAIILGGHTVNIINLAIMEELFAAILGTGDSPDLAGRFSDVDVGGETLFSDNQVSFSPHSPNIRGYVSSVLIGSLDDVGILDNQIECENDVPSIFVNTFTIGGTTRLIGNRFQEKLSFRPTNNNPFGITTLFSAWSYALMLNTTVANQGTHCFFGDTSGFARNEGRLVDANTSIIDVLFNLGPNEGLCDQMIDFLRRQSTNTGNLVGTPQATLAQEQPIAGELNLTDNVKDSLKMGAAMPEAFLMARVSNFEMAGELTTVRKVQLSRDAVRARERGDLARAEALDAAVNVEQSRSVHMAKQQKREQINPTDAAEDEAVIQGRVINEDKGAARLRVTLFDSKKELATDVTDRNGEYKLISDIAEQPRITVSDKDGKCLIELTDIKPILAGQSQYVEIDITGREPQDEIPPKNPDDPDPADQTRDVPDVIGQDPGTGAKQLRLSGFLMEITGEREDPKRIGLIVHQDPEAGTPLKTGETISVEIGRDKIRKMPDLTKKPIKDALAAIDHEALRIDSIELIKEPKMAGKVLAQFPEKDAAIAPGKPVRLKVGAGDDKIDFSTALEIVGRHKDVKSLDIPLKDLQERLKAGKITSLSALSKFARGKQAEIQKILGLKKLETAKRIKAIMVDTIKKFPK